MALPLPNTLTANTNENVNHVQANFDAVANAFPLAVNTTNFSTMPVARAFVSGAQTLATATVGVIALDGETWDLGTPSLNMHDTVTNNSRLTCRVAGTYFVAGQISYANNGTGSRHIYVTFNAAAGGTASIATNTQPTTVLANPYVITAANIYRLAVGDYVTMAGYQDSGSTLSVASSSFLSAAMVSV
jgi:hypothetical protein